jgi:hypothetical protein
MDEPRSVKYLTFLCVSFARNFLPSDIFWTATALKWNRLLDTLTKANVLNPFTGGLIPAFVQKAVFNWIKPNFRLSEIIINQGDPAVEKIYFTVKPLKFLRRLDVFTR